MMCIRMGCAMSVSSYHVFQDEERLGELAMRFRGTRDDTERRQVAANYASAIKRLIDSGSWDEIPAPERCVDACGFFEYWARKLASS